MNARSTFGAIVLTGGHSSRMGSPKAWLTVNGVPILSRVVETVRSVAEPVAVVRSRGQELPQLPPDVTVTEDEVPGCGPLAGLGAGLAAIDRSCNAIYLSSCDVPLLSPGFIEAVMDSLAAADIAVPWVGGRYHPLAAAYRIHLLSSVKHLLAAGQLRMLYLFPQARVKVVSEKRLRDVDPALLSLRNCNTRAEYDDLVRLTRRTYQVS